MVQSCQTWHIFQLLHTVNNFIFFVKMILKVWVCKFKWKNLYYLLPKFLGRKISCHFVVDVNNSVFSFWKVIHDLNSIKMWKFSEVLIIYNDLQTVFFFTETSCCVLKELMNQPITWLIPVIIDNIGFIDGLVEIFTFKSLIIINLITQFSITHWIDGFL